MVSELMKLRFNRGLPANLYFWRNRAGHEVDLLIEQPDRLVPVEIKSGQTVNTDYFKGIEDWLALAQPRKPQAWLVYGGKEDHQRNATRILSWRHLTAMSDAAE